MSVSMQKSGDKVSMAKSPVITATTSWINNKDYDIAADVVYTDGHVETVVTYPTEEGGVPVRMQTDDGAVKHLGDVGATGTGRPHETIEIRLNPNIRTVVIWGYSARKNGSGSFKQYEVELVIDNGAGEVVKMPPEFMSDNQGVYTLVIGAIHQIDGAVSVEKIEKYSRGGERRPKVSLVSKGMFGNKHTEIAIEVDKGETNVVKK